MQPTLLIWPEYDYYYTETDMEELERLMPNARCVSFICEDNICVYRLVCVDETTHSMHREQFDVFRRYVERFLVDNDRHQFDLVREYEKQLRVDYREYIEKVTLK